MNNVKTILDATSNVEWNIRVVPPCAKYGLMDQVVNTGKESLVEFFDTRYPDTELGFFVSRYKISTILLHKEGLCVSGSYSAYVDAKFIASLQNWLEKAYKNEVGLVR